MGDASVFTFLESIATRSGDGPSIGGVPAEFLLFAATLLAIAAFHRHTLAISLTGLGAITLWLLRFHGFPEGVGFTGLAAHLATEWVTLGNLAGLLLGFALLERHFERSHIAPALASRLPRGASGAFALLIIVFVLSAFLDNIAAALIGGAMAQSLYRRRVHIAYLVAIVAVANAGGAGSVIGDTTTTMLWVGGVAPVRLLEAYLGSVVALLVCGIPASRRQHAYAPMVVDEERRAGVDRVRLGIIVSMLVTVVAVNVVTSALPGDRAADFPFIGVAIWIPLLWAAPLRRPDWSSLPNASRGMVFLLALVLSASMMPVEHLPAPSWQSVAGLGTLSAVFDNIPLTALALRQGGYDWSLLAYAVGFGGSMVWFGSSAGVALSSMYPEVRSVWRWLLHGWPVVVAYAAGFAVMMVGRG